MRWTEVTLKTAPDEIDGLCLRLESLGVDGMVIEDETDFREFLENNQQYWDYVDEALEARFSGVSRVKFYLPGTEDGAKTLLEIRKAGLSPEIAYIEDSDWENNWRAFYRPLEIGGKLLVVPAWEDVEAGARVALRLDPGLIFGTGSHATTRMCLRAVERYAAPGKKVLDLGCGSGILGIAALLLGCERVTGCDIDPKAPDVAASNAALNGLGGDVFTIYAGDVLADAGLRKNLGAGFDLVLANIVADVIIPLTGMVKEFLMPGGVFVCSGVIQGRQEEVRAALERAGLSVTGHSREEGWHCFEAVRPPRQR